MISLIFVESLPTQKLDDSACDSKVYINVKKIRTRRVSFRIHARVVKLSALKQKLSYRRHLGSTLGSRSSRQKVTVIRIALD